MKKIIVLLAFVVLMSWGGLCPKDGEDGATGSSGRDAVIQSTSLEFTPAGNPQNIAVVQINLNEVKNGQQIVEVHMLWDVNKWVRLPLTTEMLGVQYDFIAIVRDGGITLETYADGVLYVGDANLAAKTLVTVIGGTW